MSMPSSFDHLDHDQKMKMEYTELVAQKCRDNPFVPIGILTTIVTVTIAVTKMKSGNKATANKWFTARVASQGATLLAVVLGGSYEGRKAYMKGQEAPRSIDEIQQEKLQNKAKERENLWIQELERRDESIKKRKQFAELKKKEMEKMKEESDKLEAELKELEKKVNSTKSK
ncbi:hypothetical protein FOG51_00914 [Hanseniaspora uvarum]|jgi:hypothetical protein|uniref:Respiratory supercomplex factor 1, mitochondrial n=1 Tax=Hanseniaspora uvarum TaxID=29833 RepID=A0A1E5RXJ1_HANUV|nr:hypothetical protein FOG48_03282 [Hanseniaspora uvarum]KAF0273957.1 hypothetical protein FOG51_00914 [Hanseniaspora uvarum]KAF0276301.1 hypothetical protein FOG50_02826 [Hanseniaspora uvarum]KKA03110.1 Respiratory supercomplex factor 1, mitochondrial [Hanseniaspora uvarum DSM 2768]OEJ91672.1 Respiratory supercomplex factor 1, mitochondrial [Hanseniaspora uvarum]